MKKNIRSKIKNQRGIILILTMMVMSILLSVALGFAVFIVSDLRQAQQVDDSVLAYYAAESGFERTIYLFRKQGKEKIADLAAADLQDSLAGNRSSWTIANSTDYEPIVFRQRLSNGQSVKLYLLNRINGSGEYNEGAVKSIAVKWKKIGICHLQTTFTQLRPQLDDAGNIFNLVDSSPISPDPAGGDKTDDDAVFWPCYSISDNDGKWNSDYAVELKAMGSDGDDCIDWLAIQGYSDDNCSSDAVSTTAISNLTIRSVGTHNNSSQEIVAQILPYAPGSGLLSFVLFSEQDITKSY
jgi:hypothetical protein